MLENELHAKVRYLHPKFRGSDELAEIGSRETRRANTEVHWVPMNDARPLAERGELDLETTGFVLAKHVSATGDFYDKDELRRVYYREVMDLVSGLVGADEITHLNHVIRTENPPNFNDAYARFVHCDWSDRRARALGAIQFKEAGIELDPDARWEFAWYNTWQPIEREVQQNPLALIDARTLGEGDLCEYLYTGNEAGEPNPSVMPVYNPEHRFYYFPRMQTDEIMVFKQLDTREGRYNPAPHTSFDDQSAPVDALGRRSVEFRVVCAFRSD